MISETPIYDQLVLERAITDPEGVALVEAIHERNGYAYRAEPGLVGRVTLPARLVHVLGGLFR